MTESTYRLPVMETVKAAWAKVGGVKGSFWAVLGIFVLLLIIVNFIGNLGGKEGVIHTVFGLIAAVIQIVGGAALLYLGIRRAQDMPITYKTAKNVLNTRTILYIIGLYILQLVVFIPAGILLGIGIYFNQTAPFIAFLFYLASVLLFIFLSVRMWLGYGIVLDKNLNPWEAIKLSFKATCDNVWNLIGLYLLTICIVIVCTITLGIGYIWGLPWLLIIYGEGYKRLSTRQDIRPLG